MFQWWHSVFFATVIINNINDANFQHFQTADHLKIFQEVKGQDRESTVSG